MTFLLLSKPFLEKESFPSEREQIISFRRQNPFSQRSSVFFCIIAFFMFYSWLSWQNCIFIIKSFDNHPPTFLSLSTNQLITFIFYLMRHTLLRLVTLVQRQLFFFVIHLLLANCENTGSRSELLKQLLKTVSLSFINFLDLIQCWIATLLWK